LYAKLDLMRCLTGLLFATLLCHAQDPARIWITLLDREVAEAELRKDYGYTEIQRNWDLDRNGRRKNEKPRERRYDNVFVEGALYRKLVAKNGVELSGGEKKRVEQEVARTAQERREERRRGARFFPGTRYMRIGELKHLPDAVTFHPEPDEEIGGVTAWVLRADPLPASRIEAIDPKRKELAAYQQRFWIRKSDGLLLRRWVRVIGPGAELLPGSEVTFEMGSPQPGLPSFELRRSINFAARIMGVSTARAFQEHQFLDFRKYDVASTITFEEPHR
jgi:hypothetical protein